MPISSDIYIRSKFHRSGGREGDEVARARREESRMDANPRKAIEGRRMCAYQEKAVWVSCVLERGLVVDVISALTSLS